MSNANTDLRIVYPVANDERMRLLTARQPGRQPAVEAIPVEPLRVSVAESFWTLRRALMWPFATLGAATAVSWYFAHSPAGYPHRPAFVVIARFIDTMRAGWLVLVVFSVMLSLGQMRPLTALRGLVKGVATYMLTAPVIVLAFYWAIHQCLR